MKPRKTSSGKIKTAVSKPKKKRKKLLFQSVKGMADILPADQWRWDLLREKIKKIAERYNFGRIDTPLVEQAEIFEQSAGESTDIVEKQMFFIKNSRERLVLRPEGTAPVVRAYLEHGLSRLPQPLRLFYLGPFFRHEQPQSGRFRQFFQAGFEILGGESDPIYDAQAILLAYRLLEGLKISHLRIEVNTIGCRACRAVYRRRLVDFYRNKGICRNCRRRIAANPLRLLDCKNKKCEELKEEAPIILDSICSECNCYFQTVLEYLESVNLPYSLNHYLVRGLDYYNKTVFEVFSEDGSSALIGGGRFDYLADKLGGAAMPAVGFSVGLERIIAVMKESGTKPPRTKQLPKVFLVHVGNLAKKSGLALLDQLRKSGIKVSEAFDKSSLKAQLKQADRERVKLALIFGQKEAFEGTIIIRDMETGAQETVPLNRLMRMIKKKLR